MQKRISLSDENPTFNKAQELLLHHDLKFVTAEYLDPLSRFYARIALQHKIGYIPKQVLKYIEWKRIKGESLKWDFDTLDEVVKEDKFDLVKWAGTLNKYLKASLCWRAARFGKLHMLKWARKQQPPLPWDKDTCAKAFTFGHYDTLKWLVENGCPWRDSLRTDFHRYVNIFEDKDKWKKIVVNQVIYRQTTTLMMASHFGHVELVTYLLTRDGIDVNMEDSIGRTCLIKACQNGHLDVVKLLLSHEDINVNKANQYGETVLHNPSFWGHIEMIKEILSHPNFRNINKRNHNRASAYDVAKRRGHHETAKLIMSHADYNGSE
eukprot:g6229.t1